MRWAVMDGMDLMRWRRDGERRARAVRVGERLAASDRRDRTCKLHRPARLVHQRERAATRWKDIGIAGHALRQGCCSEGDARGNRDLHGGAARLRRLQLKGRVVLSAVLIEKGSHADILPEAKTPFLSL